MSSTETSEKTNKISIALCTYNGEKYLREQLESFSAQTRQPDELIVCDDRSTDATVKIVEDFARAASFPVSIHVNETNLGSTKNFERAISLCAGDLIFLSDQDDVWLPEKIERFVSEFEKSANVGMIFSNAALVGETLEPLNHNLWDTTFTPEEKIKARAGRMLEILLKRNIVTGATMAFRAAFLDLILPIPTDIPNTIHDAWIALVIAANAEVSFIEENLIYYRQHAAQQLGIDWKYREKLKEKLKKTPRRERYAEDYNYEQREQKRFSKLAEIVENHPHFQKADIKNLLGKLRDSFIKESLEKAAHYEVRRDLPSNRLRRIAPIFKEMRSGRYGKFSKGFVSALKDLTESW